MYICPKKKWNHFLKMNELHSAHLREGGRNIYVLFFFSFFENLVCTIVYIETSEDSLHHYQTLLGRAMFLLFFDKIGVV